MSADMEEETMLSNFHLSDANSKQKSLGKRHGVKLRGRITYKIIMGGGSNRGQTSFIQRYISGEFGPTTPTIGIDFALKHLEWEDGRKVTLQFWDIAGQERTETMSRMYYQDAHACVIMFDMTYDKSLDICVKWKKELDSKCTLEDGEPIPCILLANKSDLASKRKFTSEEIEKFAQEHNFIHSMETSVRNNKNVTEAMNFLVGHLLTKENYSPTKPKTDEGNISVKSPAAQSAAQSNKPCC